MAATRRPSSSTGSAAPKRRVGPAATLTGECQAAPCWPTDPLCVFVCGAGGALLCHLPASLGWGSSEAAQVGQAKSRRSCRCVPQVPCCVVAVPKSIDNDLLLVGLQWEGSLGSGAFREAQADRSAYHAGVQQVSAGLERSPDGSQARCLGSALHRTWHLCRPTVRKHLPRRLTRPLGLRRRWRRRKRRSWRQRCASGSSSSP